MKYFNIIIAVLITGTIFYSCDKIDPPYIIDEGGQDTAACPVPEFPTKTYTQKVLMEEFTGHKCPNCPEGTAIAHDLYENYYDTIVLVTVHAGSLATPEDGLYEYDFRTPAGDDYNSKFLIWANPSAMLNRKHWGATGYTLLKEQWEGKIQEIIQEEPKLGVQIIVDYDSINREACIHVQVEKLETMDNDLGLVVYITENNIVKPQKDGNEDIIDYNHNHVLRDVVTPAYGTGIYVEGDHATTITRTFQYFVSEEWKHKDISIVAYVSDRDTDEVYQAESIHLID